jgi:transposase
MGTAGPLCAPDAAGVLPYAYCTGIRSSRQIERRCREDIAFRVLAGNSTSIT